jgi:phage terminase small subunit
MAKKKNPSKLNMQQTIFVIEYVKSRNATQAAIKAGYSDKTAASAGYRLLRNVYIQAEIERRLDDLAAAANVTVERVLKERARIAFFDPRNLFDDTGAPIPVQSLDDDSAAAIAGLDVVTQGGTDGAAGVVMKIKIADKNAALTALEKHLGMYRDEVEKNPTFNIHMHL